MLLVVVAWDVFGEWGEGRWRCGRQRLRVILHAMRRTSPHARARQHAPSRLMHLCATLPFACGRCGPLPLRQVVAVGAGRKDEDGKVTAPNVKPGSTVMYSKYSGTEFEVRAWRTTAAVAARGVGCGYWAARGRGVVVAPERGLVRQGVAGGAGSRAGSRLEWCMLEGE